MTAMRCGWHGQTLCGAVLLAALALPPLRHALEASMTLHMLVQYAGLMLAGALLFTGLPPAARWRLAAWNTMGLAGLVAVALVLAVLMIPRVLDLALVDVRVETAKYAALLLAGTALRASWHQAGMLVQGFFLGNVLPMTGTIGWLYEESPLRVCNAYGLEDQQRLGLALIWIAWAVGIGWLVYIARAMTRHEAGLAALDG